MREKIEFMVNPPESLEDTHKQMAYNLARSVCNEGMSLFSAFVMLLNYQRFGKMKGMCEIVEWSIRDETLHVEGMTTLFRVFCEENPKVVTNNLKHYIYENYKKAVVLEDALVDLLYRNKSEICGLSSSDIKTYVRYLADRRLIQLGLKGIFKQKTNPIKWLDWVVSGDSHKNFFEGVTTDYSGDGLSGEWDWSGVTL
jgi:ribonucleotide reductase beta subunit family protein with ferritin-like domain